LPSTITPRSPSILAVLNGHSNCERARIVLPWSILKARYGWTADWFSQEELVAQKGNGLGAYDLYVLPRLIPEQEWNNPWVEFRKMGKRFVYELDDDFTSLHEDNIVAQELLDHPEHVREHLKVVSACDAVTVSTKHLGQRVAPYNKNVHVLPNCIFPGDWEKKYPRIHRGLTVGWMGSPSHTSDLKLLVEPLRILAERHPKVKFVFGGFCLPEIREMLGDRMIEMERVPIEDYAGMVQQIDIGLAPLVDSTFNRSKSNIKFLEYAMGGAAVVASPVEPYQCINHTVTGFWARTTEDWVRHVGQLIRNQELRSQVARQARQWVLTNHNILNEAWRWGKVYEGIARR
jgi:glycosyltransferase involved in cell wall biosynthesis